MVSTPNRPASSGPGFTTILMNSLLIATGAAFAAHAPPPIADRAHRAMAMAEAKRRAQSRSRIMENMQSTSSCRRWPLAGYRMYDARSLLTQTSMVPPSYPTRTSR